MSASSFSPNWLEIYKTATKIQNLIYTPELETYKILFGI